MIFLNSSLPIDLANPILNFCTNSSMNALRITNKDHQQIVESSPHLSKTSKNIICGNKELLETKLKYKNLPKIEVIFANLFNFRNEFGPVTYLFKSVFPVVNKVLTLKEEISERIEDLPLSRLFGKKAEFEALPKIADLHLGHRMPSATSWPAPIVRCELSLSDNGKKTCLLIRGIAGQSILTKAYIHFPRSNKWNSLEDLKFNIHTYCNTKAITDDNGKKTAAYDELCRILKSKQFTEYGTTYTVE